MKLLRPKTRIGRAAAAAFVLLVVGLDAAPASADVIPKVNCQGQGGNYLEGGRLPVDADVYGVKARIETLDPELCGGNSTTSFSSAWVMVTAPSKLYSAFSDHDGWAQAGYIQAGSGACFDGDCGDAKIRAFTQFTLECRSNSPNGCTGYSTHTVFGGEVPLESSGHYWVYENISGSGSNYMYLWANSERLDTITSYDPVAVWKDEWRVQFIGETGHMESDIPGTPADKVNFDTLKYYDAARTQQDLKAKPTHYNSPVTGYRFETFDPPTGYGKYGIKIWTDPYHG